MDGENGRASGSAKIQSFRDLKVWQEGMDLAVACYVLTRPFPRDEAFGMTSQIRRAAASVPATIAEGHGRETRGEFVKFLRIAQGSLKELETHLLLAQRLTMGSAEQTDAALQRADRLGRMIRALLRSLQAT